MEAPERMPIFEYRCHACGRRFEALLSRAEAESAQPCPKCGAEVGGRDRPGDRLLSVFAATGGAAEAAGGGGGEACGDTGGGCGATTGGGFG
jgi:putative FmdB family regulatory protein